MFLVWWALYAVIMWILIGFVLSSVILFYVWYKGCSITTGNIRPIILITILGPLAVGLFIYVIIDDRFTEIKHNITHNCQDGKIILHGRKSPRVLRYLKGNEK